MVNRSFHEFNSTSIIIGVYGGRKKPPGFVMDAAAAMNHARGRITRKKARRMPIKRLLTLCVACLVLLSGMISPARADASFNYLDENGDLRQQAIAADHVIGGVWNIGSETLAGWYAVTGTLTIAHTLRVEGEAHLILTDGASLTVNATSNKAGIEVSEGDSLTVYAQSVGAGMGSLTASGGSYCAAIGGSRGDSYQNCWRSVYHKREGHPAVRRSGRTMRPSSTSIGCRPMHLLWKPLSGTATCLPPVEHMRKASRTRK